MTIELVLLLLAALAFFLLTGVWLRSSTRPKPAPPRHDYLPSDAHIDQRRRELARLSHPAAKGIAPRWRFDAKDKP